MFHFLFTHFFIYHFYNFDSDSDDDDDDEEEAEEEEEEEEMSTFDSLILASWERQSKWLINDYAVVVWALCFVSETRNLLSYTCSSNRISA